MCAGEGAKSASKRRREPLFCRTENGEPLSYSPFAFFSQCCSSELLQAFIRAMPSRARSW